MHEVVNDAVGVDGRAVVRQLGSPLGQPTVSLGLNLPCRCVVIGAAFTHYLPAGFYHLTEHQLGVAHDGVVDIVILVNVLGVVGGPMTRPSPVPSPWDFPQPR